MRSSRRARTADLAPYAAGLVALGIGCYQMSLPHVLTGVLGYNLGYDDGVYAGVSIRLVHGVLPYRDFVFVQPPGIAYILAPFSALGVVLGSHAALILDRCLTVVVVAANAVLAGRLLRPAGRLAMIVASFALAVWPLAVAVDRGVELEPYVVFFALLGALVLFARGGDPSHRRLLLAGALLGFAVVVKTWGVLPAAAALLVFLPRWRRGGQWLLLGMAAGAVVPCAPFLVTAPRAFVHEVIFDQLGRQNAYAATRLGPRLLTISGADALSAFSVAAGVAVAVFVVFGVAVIGLFALSYRRCTRLEWFALAAGMLALAGMFASPIQYDHYAYFPAAFLAVLLGVCAGRASATIARLRGERSTLRHSAATPVRIPRVAPGLSLLVAVGLVVFLIQQDTAFAGSYLSEASRAPSLASYIPPGACVISDFPSDLLAASRSTPSTPGCPAVIDPFGMYLSGDDGRSPHLDPPAFRTSFVALWFVLLQRADYVELRIPYSDLIPWVPAMITWFSDNFRLIAHLDYAYAKPYIDAVKDIYVYQRIT